MLACMFFFHLFVNFTQEKIAITPETKCIETVIMFVFAAIVILWQKELFFETDHIGNLPETEETVKSS